MEIETLKHSHLKRNIIIGLIAVLIISAIVLNFTRAKYRVTDSVPLIEGVINYSPGDIIITAYLDDKQLETFPEKGTVSFNSITCDNNATASFDTTNWQINVSNLTQKGTKCDVYFKESVPAKDTILAGKDIQTRNDFNTTVIDTTTGIMYQTSDWKGTSYYFAGAPTDNWVRFGGFYWRIVRVNGDGSVRLIYNGTNTSTTSAGTLADISEQFNSRYNQSEYVGLKYTTGQQHGQNTDSPILNTLQSWYNSSGLSATQYSQYIDTSVGFCSDRNMASGSSWSSQPSSSNIYYAAYGRLYTNKNPNLSCTNSDIIMEPVGLITADEVAYAGGVYGSRNASYYLYNGQDYWTMSPSYFSGTGAYILYVSSNGNLSDYRVSYTRGVRPVINLSASVTVTGSGTTTDPYVVEGAA